VSGLIKSGTAGEAEIRPLGFPGAAPMRDARDDELHGLRAEAARLVRELDARDADIEKLSGAAVNLVAEAEEKGRQAGLREAATREKERVQALSDAAGKALARFGDSLAGMERLGALVARAALDKLFGEEGRRAELAVALLRRQMDEIEARSVVRVEVSRADFPEAAAAASLGALLDRSGLEVIASERLSSGDCRIVLLLGTVEAGLSQQWGVLRQLLDEMGEGRGAS
jgi:flagellar biosynthesis/type III secretory pathway protein FliH